jgi:tetratricopeptide (TPR) repeat protein
MKKAGYDFSARAFLRHHKRADKAIECYNRAIRAEPNNWTAWELKGNTFTDLGKYEEAVECYNKVLEIEPENMGALGAKEEALLKLGKHAQAEKCAKERRKMYKLWSARQAGARQELRLQ